MPLEGAELARPPAAGLDGAVAVWQPSRGQRLRDGAWVLSGYLLADAVVVWGAGWRVGGWGLLLLGGVCGLHLLAARRPGLAAGPNWLRAGRRWVRLDQLCQVTARQRTLTLVDAQHRQVRVDLDDLLAERRLAELVLAAVFGAVDEGRVRCGPLTQALLGLPLQRQRRPRSRRPRGRGRDRDRPRDRPGGRSRDDRRRGSRRGSRSARRLLARRRLPGRRRALPIGMRLLLVREAAVVLFTVLALLGTPVLLGWLAWRELLPTGSGDPVPGTAQSLGWVVYAAGWVVGGVGIAAYYRMQERALGPMGYARRAGIGQHDPPRALRERLGRIDGWLLTGYLGSFPLLGVHRYGRLLWFGATSGMLLVTIGWLVFRWLPWLRGQPPPTAPGPPTGPSPPGHPRRPARRPDQPT